MADLPLTHGSTQPWTRDQRLRVLAHLGPDLTRREWAQRMACGVRHLEALCDEHRVTVADYGVPQDRQPVQQLAQRALTLARQQGLSIGDTADQIGISHSTLTSLARDRTRRAQPMTHAAIRGWVQQMERTP